VANQPGSKQEGKANRLAEVRALARIANQYDLSEVEVERDGMRIRIRREHNGAQPLPQQLQIPAAPPAAAAVAAGTPPADAAPDRPPEGSVVVSSPFVGTFYRAPNPDAPPFVEAGQSVEKGQVLCIVEAMKLMNEIETEVDGKILEILVPNGEPVEFGQSLFRILPLSKTG
jgi:acetyl-CoA carboxylase biotin carboxyl carrier protein